MAGNDIVLLATAAHLPQHPLAAVRHAEYVMCLNRALTWQLPMLVVVAETQDAFPPLRDLCVAPPTEITYVPSTVALGAHTKSAKEYVSLRAQLPTLAKHCRPDTWVIKLTGRYLLLDDSFLHRVKNAPAHAQAIVKPAGRQMWTALYALRFSVWQDWILSTHLEDYTLSIELVLSRFLGQLPPEAIVAVDALGILMDVDNAGHYSVCMKARAAAIFFHANALRLYKKRWLDDCIRSVVVGQTFRDFDVYEVDYGAVPDGNLTGLLCEEHKIPMFYFALPMPNQAWAASFCMYWAYSKRSYAAIFIINMDDVYSENHFSVLWEQIHMRGVDVASGCLRYIREQGEEDVFAENMPDLVRPLRSEEIRANLLGGNNVLCNPGSGISERFFLSLRDARGNRLRYRADEWPEDYSLWLRAATAPACIFCVRVESVLRYRIHEKQTGASELGKCEALWRPEQRQQLLQTRSLSAPAELPAGTPSEQLTFVMQLAMHSDFVVCEGEKLDTSDWVLRFFHV